MAAQVFITNDKVNVVGLIVAGSAEFKTVLVEAERFDQRLAAKVSTRAQKNGNEPRQRAPLPEKEPW